jgi:MgtE-like protein
VKPVIIGAASFVLALGLSTGVAVLRHKSPAPHATAAKTPADSTHKRAPADSTSKPPAVATNSSTAKDSSAHDSTAATPAAADSAHHDSTAVAVAPVIPSAAAPVITPPVATLAAHKAVDEPDYKQIAKIFANMKAADAAKVLSYMTDDEVQGVIEKLNVRQAAELMTKLPKDRVAALSRRLAAAPARP